VIFNLESFIISIAFLLIGVFKLDNLLPGPKTAFSAYSPASVSDGINWFTQLVFLALLIPFWPVF
jgi:hypothetical protein